jgi:hypothetical protein
MFVALFLIGSENPLLDHALAQWRATPEARIEDAYKWLYHATLGGEHAVTDEQGPRAWLDREWETIGAPLKGEQGLVPLTSDGRLLRVNLRPYKQRGGDKEMLLWAFVFSAERFKPDRSGFVREWDALGARLRSRPQGHLTAGEWTRLDATARKAAFPAAHHSPEYERAYRPAYRVVLREFL